ncbi:MAG: type II secretion system protein [Desulfobacteraceae bacterium]
MNTDAEKGFTLLELIASLVLLGLLSAVFGMGLVAAMQSHEFNRYNVHLAQKSQTALMRISRELRELNAIEAVSSGGDPFIIYRRTDPSNQQSTVRYGLHFDSASHTLFLYTALDPNIGTLNSATTGNGDILINGVSSFSLQYLQGGSPWAWGSDFELLSSIQVNLQLIRPERPDITEDFSTLVHLRNTNNYGGAAPTTHPVAREDYSCFIDILQRTSGR